MRSKSQPYPEEHHGEAGMRLEGRCTLVQHAEKGLPARAEERQPASFDTRSGIAVALLR